MIDYTYQKLLADILTNGQTIKGRNSEVIRLTNLIAKFTSTPLISVRKTAWKNALREFEWFLSGSNNINDLHEKVRHWWEPWADKKTGIINYNYGHQFRNSHGTHGDGIDQISKLIYNLQIDPFSRRNIITTWNTVDMLSPFCPITNCHGSLIMTSVNQDKTLHLTMVQRSADMILGVPHNWIQYWAFLLWLSNKTNLNVGSLTWIGHDCHIYNEHINVAKRIVKEESEKIVTPKLVYNLSSSEFKTNDFILDGKYTPYLNEKVKMIV